MSELDKLAQLVLKPWSKDVPEGEDAATLPEGEKATGIWWADRMKELLNKAISAGSERYSLRQSGKLIVRSPKIEKDGKPWAGIILGGGENEKTGKYRGDSFVIFPSESHGCVLTLALGSLGPGDDVEYLSRAELARNVKAIADYVNIDIMSGQSCAWSKPTPSRTDINEMPLDCCANIPDDDCLNNVLDAYKTEIYLAVNVNGMQSDQAKAVLVLLMDQFLLNHGCTLRRGLARDAKFRKYIFPTQDEQSVFERIKTRRYVILEGPPGTGKTRLCAKLKDIKEQGSTENYYSKCWKIQFHPNMTYEQFVGGLYPKMVDDVATFAPKEGILLQAIAEARDNPNNHYLLHIDEINRADLSRVLGEAISLFEPRADYVVDVNLPFAFEHFMDAKIVSMPLNLHVIGTMNSADRSIAILDIAIRRRFSFYQLYPQPQVVDEHGTDFSKQAFHKLEELFAKYASEEAFKYMPGHAYFIGNAANGYNDDESKRQLRYELIPLLQEYIEQGYVSGFAGQIRAYIQEWDGKCGDK